MYQPGDFLFGCAYYYEYQLEKDLTGMDKIDLMRRDFQRMKRAGMNYIRIAESTWSTLEKTEGVYTFDHIDVVLEEAEKAGLYVVIGTPTYAIPAWMARKYPEVCVEGKEGRVSYGPRQSMDIFNPDYRRLAENMLRAFFSHLAEHPAVIGWQLDNETKHYGSYSKYAQGAFVEYLKERFQGDVEALNNAYGLHYWSNSIYDWADFPPLQRCINGGLSGAYEHFLRHGASEFLHRQEQILSEYKRPEQFVTHNLDFNWKQFGPAGGQEGFSFGVHPDIDHYEVGKFLSLPGCDIYHPSQDRLTGKEISFCGSEIYGLKDQNYIILETESQAFKEWTPYPGQLYLQAMSHVANGAKGVAYWNWNSLHNSFETYWRGILNHDLEESRIYREISEIGQHVEKIWPAISGFTRENDIALLVSNDSLTALNYFPVDADCSYNDIVRVFYDALYELNLQCDVLHVERVEEHPELLKNYKMVLTPALYCVRPELTDLLRDFVEKGGTLVSSFKSFYANHDFTVYPERKPYKLWDLFGVCYHEFTAVGRATVAGAPAKYFAELLEAVETENVKETGGVDATAHTDITAEILERYEHPYWKEYGAISRSKVGASGHTYYFATLPAIEILKKYLAMAAKDAGVETPDCTWPLIHKTGRNAKGQMVHFLLNYSEEQAEYTWNYNEARLLPDHTPIYRGEKIILKDWDVKIIVV